MNDFIYFVASLFHSEKDKLARFDVTKLIIVIAILVVAFIICVKITEKNKLYEGNNKKKGILHT